MKSPFDRLRTAREAAGYETARAAATRFGWEYSTYAGHENGNRNFGRSAAETYARAFRVSAGHLLFGEEIEPVEHDGDSPPGSDLIPVYDVTASAGHGVATGDYEAVAYSLAFPPGYLAKLSRSHPRYLAMIGVKGDSMRPTLNDDDLVMVDTSKKNLAYDGLFVLRYDEALHVKRVARAHRRDYITIISDNRDFYPAFELPGNEVEVIGKVIWCGVRV